MVQIGGSLKAATRAGQCWKLKSLSCQSKIQVQWNQRKSATVECSVDPRAPQKNLNFMTEVWRLNVEQLRVFTLKICISQYLSILYSANDNMKCMAFIMKGSSYKSLEPSHNLAYYPSSRTIGVRYITQEIPVMDLKYFSSPFIILYITIIQYTRFVS